MRSAMEPLLQRPAAPVGLAGCSKALCGLPGRLHDLNGASSSATVALLQAWRSQGRRHYHNLLGLMTPSPILLEDNIGTTITAVAAIGREEMPSGWRLRYALLTWRRGGVLCTAAARAALVRLCSPLQGQECAVITADRKYALFNVLYCAGMAALTGQMVRLVCALLPDKNRPGNGL